MEPIHVPWTDVGNAPRLLLRSWQQHRTSRAPLASLVLQTVWKPGPAAQDGGPFLISLTQFTPRWITDMLTIWRTADELGDQLRQIGGAVGVMTYVQPGRRRLGSMSVWADEEGLAQFMALPDHVETMHRYRSRGLPLRSAKWWSEDFQIGSALTEGLRLLERHQERRVIVATS
ncbi:hypothetical protein BOX37_05930 [Nocardia mangyaensis]|uniref:DUF3291 domain-containing protein n=1 Tax=Nocardia mangyaensis TaxID=2213200 RepID=A0A1J0VNH3_9NOCA|nr:hypothetical protein [Nocardia mangyaensis]APE33584.1 hypothetical protein BOX37_05930 [Nocardia mangyaensis]